MIGDTELPHVFLPPGALFCSERPGVVSTVLGSCVAVCLWDRERHICGINHFILPRSTPGEPPSLRYGDVSIDRLVETMLRFGGAIWAFDAKVFGGGAVLPYRDDRDNIGDQNVDIAITRLETLGIRIVAQRTGGTRGLAVRLFTATGEVLVRTAQGSDRE